MMIGTVAQQTEPHTWRGQPEVFDGGGHVTTVLNFTIGNMAATFGGRGGVALQATYRNIAATFAGIGSVSFMANNLRMSATYVGAGLFFLASANANLLRKGSVAFNGASTLSANGTIQ